MCTNSCSADSVSETQAGFGDQEHLPFFELLDVVYGRFEAGAIVEQEARGFEVLVAGDSSWPDAAA